MRNVPDKSACVLYMYSALELLVLVYRGKGENVLKMNVEHCKGPHTL
jgi:hypothetical protein